MNYTDQLDYCLDTFGLRRPNQPGGVSAPNRSGLSRDPELLATAECAGVRWDDVIRIEACGSDACGSFQVSVTFTHADGEETTIFTHDRGYQEIIALLPRRFPSISATWHQDARRPWRMQQLLYSREN